MSDRLFLSCTFPEPPAAMTGHFEKLLERFPLSRLSNAPLTVRVHAISESEPPVYEDAFGGEGALDQVRRAVREFFRPDCAAMVDAAWDLWQYDREWKLAPARVTLIGFGPEFEGTAEEHLRVDFGVETHFLPQPDLPNYLTMAQSNIRSLLHLVADLDKEFPGAKRRLWTESGENFAAKVAGILEAGKPGPRLVS